MKKKNVSVLKSSSQNGLKVGLVGSIGLMGSVALLGNATSVSANTVTAPAEGSQVTPVATNTVTAQDVATAKTNLDTATQAVETQTGIVNDANTVVNNAQTAVDSANTAVKDAQAVADQATPEAITKQQGIVDATQSAINTSQAEISNEKQVINSKQAEVSSQEIIVNQAQADVKSKELDVANAQIVKDQAQAVLDGTGATELYNQKGSLETKVAQDQMTVSDAQTNLNNAQNSDQKLASDIATKTSEVSSKTAQVSTEKSNIDQAKQALNNATTALTNAKSEQAKAQAAVNGINTFVISQEYADTLKAFVNADYGTQLRSDLKSKLDTLSESLKAQNVYKSNANDKLVSIPDVNNMSKDMLQELALFGSDLSNQIRSLFGTVKTVVTPDSIDMSDLVTDGYVADGWGWNSVVTKGHDTIALENAGNNSDIGTSVGIGENLNTISQTTGPTNLDYVKSLIFRAYVDYMYSDTHVSYAHSESISGLSESSSATKTYIGIDISSVEGATSVHVNDVSDSQLVNTPEFDQTVIENSESAATLKAVLEDKNKLLSSAQSNYENAQTSYNSAQTKYALATTQLTALVKQLEALKATPLKTPLAKTQLTAAQNLLANDQASLKAINDSIATLEADVATKKTKLDQAKAILSQKINILTQAKNVLKVDTDKLNSLKSELANLKSVLASDQTRLQSVSARLAVETNLLNSLINADDKLAQAQADLATKEAALADAKAKYDTEKAILDDLIAKQKAAQADYDRLKALYDAYLKAQEEARLAKEKAAIIAKGGIPVAIVNEAGQITGYVDGRVKNESSQQAVSYKPVSHYQAAAYASETQLPTTNESNSVTYSILALSGISISLLFIKKRKED